MNNLRNFITRSTNNFNTVRFQNARSTTAGNTSTTVNRNKKKLNSYLTHLI